MVSLTDQISRSLLSPGYSGNSMPPSPGMSAPGPAPATHITSLVGCKHAELLGTPTLLCPTQFPIIKKTRLVEPKMIIFGTKGYTVTSFWSTGTAFFYQTVDRMIIAVRADGTAKVYRPRKHIVVSSNPRVRNLVRARDKLDKLSKNLRSAIGVSSSPARRKRKK